MEAEFLPVVVDVVSINRPRAGDPVIEPYIVELATEGDRRLFLPLSVAAVQALVQLLDPEQQAGCDCTVASIAGWGK